MPLEFCVPSCSTGNACPPISPAATAAAGTGMGAPAPEQRTNTLIITSLPLELFHTVAQDALKRHFSSYGLINQWAPISSFRRVIVVFEDDDAAETAKRECDPVVIPSSSSNCPPIMLRVYRADPNPLLSLIDDDYYMPESAYLRPPDIEKNFLISPPGTPPLDWVPIREDPPNAAPLAEDLIEALKQLQLQRQYRQDDQDTPGMMLLLESEGSAGVSVYVEDCDFRPECEHRRYVDWGDDDDGDFSPSIVRKPPATALPPQLPGTAVL